MDEPRAYMESQDSPWPGLGGSQNLPSYNILYDWPWGLHLNVIFSQDFQFGSPKILEIGTPAILLSRPLIEVRYKTKL